MDPRWPRLPQPTVAWSATDDDDLDRAGFVINRTELSLASHDPLESSETVFDESWREGSAGRVLFSEARSSW